MSIPPLLNGPIPLYNNPPIEPQYFKPSLFFISSISLGLTTTVTMTDNNNYVIGQLCRLIIPISYGSRELNEQTGYVISIPAPNQVVLNIDSRNASAFINANLPTPPQIVAVGDINTGPINGHGRFHTSIHIPGSFENISPF